MSSELPFPHHTFSGPADEGRFELVSSDAARPTDDVGPTACPGVAQSLGSADVREVMLIHGTFAGNDIIGMLRLLHRFSPRLTATMKELGKRWFDEFADEVGNFTPEYADCLADLVNDGSHRPITVSRCLWSGENHHLGRALGAIALLDTILSRVWQPGDRLLLLAHSHGGNLLAMLTLLLGGSSHAREKFFDAIAPQRSGASEIANWDRVQSFLLDSGSTSPFPAIDVATLGTPLRYRWDLNVCDHLLHFVQHRSLIDAEPARASWPKSVGDVTSAKGGDYIQHLGIGGTDFPHQLLAWKDWRAERRLRQIFEPNVWRRHLRRNLGCGHRLSLDGKTFLVDYPVTPARWNQKLFGHGVYTCRQWLPFHLEAIAREFYQ